MIGTGLTISLMSSTLTIIKEDYNNEMLFAFK
jgi:hypothetical protein